jgi:DNA-binding transcriptional regulator YiaG
MRQIDNRDRFAPRDRPEPHWSEVLRALRETAGVTQEGWAAQLGHGRRSIQRWEHAELAPDAAATEALVRLCTQLGLFREHQRGVLAGLRLTPECGRWPRSDGSWRRRGS